MRPRHLLSGLAAALSLFAAGAAQAQQAPPPKEGFNLQGEDHRRWMDNPHMRAFYQLTRTSFADGWNRVDFPTYQEKAFTIFRGFGTEMGVGPEAMVDHLKAIPGQMLQIVADDPSTLDSFDAFVTALMGPP